MPIQFLPIAGVEIPSTTMTTVFTAPVANTVVTSFSVVSTVGSTSMTVTVYRTPSGAGSPDTLHIIASEVLDAGERLDLRNIFMANGSTLRVNASEIGAVAYGNYSRESA